MLFVGTHEHSLDEKGRVVLPAKFRSRFTAEAFISPAANCIAIYTPEAFSEMVSRLQSQIKEGTVDYKWQGNTFKAPSHLVRNMVPPLIFYSAYELLRAF